MNLNYAIFRSEPIMTLHDLAQIGSHNKREKKAYNSNPDIRKELSNNNRSYLVFSEEDYYFYEDINNMEAKYDTGKYTLENGFEELNQIGLKNNFFNKLMDKINTELENTSFSILKLDSKRSFENGVEVRTNLTEEESYGVVVITSHDGIVELIISGITNGEERHYYKVVKSNE